MKLVVDDLACRRGERPVFAGVSFSVAAGAAVVVTGRNGAGKSSLLAILAGLLLPAAGGVSIAPDRDRPPAEHMNLVGHRDALKPALTAEENLVFAQAVLGTPDRTPQAALDAFGLAHAAALPVGYLSAGQRRRVALARLLVSARPIWLLDEPAAALDAASQATLADVMHAHLAAGGLIVAATHGPLGLTGAQELRLDASSPLPTGKRSILRDSAGSGEGAPA